MEKSEIPVVFCGLCDQKMPVVIRKLDLTEFEDDQTLNDELRELIYCPGCSNILNLDKELRVEWYDPSELHKAIGFKVTGGDNGRE